MLAATFPEHEYRAKDFHDSVDYLIYFLLINEAINVKITNHENMPYDLIGGTEC